MSDVTTITSTQPDSAARWRTALERLLVGDEFGRQIVLAQFAERQIFACFNGEEVTITSDEEAVLNAEVYIPLPMLNMEKAWIYSGVLFDDLLYHPGIFRRCWHDSPAAKACAAEMRQQLEEDITFWRQMAAEMHEEMRRTDKLIAIV
jgi:hypothetical protein